MRGGPRAARGTTGGHTGGGAGAISTALRPTSRSTRLHRLTSSGGTLAQSAAKHISFNPKSRLPPVLGNASSATQATSSSDKTDESTSSRVLDHSSYTKANPHDTKTTETRLNKSSSENSKDLEASRTVTGKVALKSASTSELGQEQDSTAFRAKLNNSSDESVIKPNSSDNIVAAKSTMKSPASAPLSSPRRQLNLSSLTQPLPPTANASLNRLTSVMENEPTQADEASTSKASADASGRMTGSRTGRRNGMNELDALEAILRKAQVSSRHNSSTNISTSASTARRSTTAAARRYDFSQEALLSGSGARTSPRLKREGHQPQQQQVSSSSSSTYLYKDPLKSGRRSSNARPNLDRFLSDPSGSDAPVTSRSASVSSRPTTTQKLAATSTSGAPTLEALKESLDGLHTSPTQPPSTSLSRHQVSSTSGRRSGGGRKSHMGGVVLESLNPSQVRVVSGVLSSLVKNGSAAGGSAGASGVSPTATSKSRNGYVTSTLEGRITPTEGRLLVSM